MVPSARLDEADDDIVDPKCDFGTFRERHTRIDPMQLCTVMEITCQQTNEPLTRDPRACGKAGQTMPLVLNPAFREMVDSVT